MRCWQLHQQLQPSGGVQWLTGVPRWAVCLRGSFGRVKSSSSSAVSVGVVVVVLGKIVERWVMGFGGGEFQA